MRDVARDDHRPGQREPRLDWVAAELGTDLAHRTVEVDADDVVVEVIVGDLGQEVRGVGLELLEEDAVGGDLALGLAVGRARDGDRDRQARAVSGEPDDPHVVTEVLAAELRADAELTGELEDLVPRVRCRGCRDRRWRLRSAGCRGSARWRAWRS